MAGVGRADPGVRRPGLRGCCRAPAELWRGRPSPWAGPQSHDRDRAANKGTRDEERYRTLPSTMGLCVIKCCSAGRSHPSTPRPETNPASGRFACHKRGKTALSCFQIWIDGGSRPPAGRFDGRIGPRSSGGGDERMVDITPFASGNRNGEESPCVQQHHRTESWPKRT